MPDPTPRTPERPPEPRHKTQQVKGEEPNFDLVPEDQPEDEKIEQQNDVA